MPAESKAKTIERNRSPRVQIAYDVETYGSPTTIELPFVMGVMADLAGASETKEAAKTVQDRSFVEVDAQRFPRFMEALGPRVKARVKNTLPQPEGEERDEELALDLTFSGMADFAPDRDRRTGAATRRDTQDATPARGAPGFHGRPRQRREAYRAIAQQRAASGPDRLPGGERGGQGRGIGTWLKNRRWRRPSQKPRLSISESSVTSSRRTSRSRRTTASDCSSWCATWPWPRSRARRRPRSRRTRSSRSSR